MPVKINPPDRKSLNQRRVDALHGLYGRVDAHVQTFKAAIIKSGQQYRLVGAWHHEGAAEYRLWTVGRILTRPLPLPLAIEAFHEFHDRGEVGEKFRPPLPKKDTAQKSN